jgi:hypothetical protein
MWSVGVCYFEVKVGTKCPASRNDRIITYPIKLEKDQKLAITTGDRKVTFGCGVGKYFNACCFRELASSDFPGVLMMCFTLCFTTLSALSF